MIISITAYLLLGYSCAVGIILYLAVKLRRVREQIAFIQDALEDIKKGNCNRRVLTRKTDITKHICYAINEITLNSQQHLIQHQQAERAYKRLMTSLSHDVKTPLASLVGYLEAIEGAVVAGTEKDAYLHVA
ncbi:MAG: hypothetical protein ACTTJ7_06880 [Treponema sp.]